MKMQNSICERFRETMKRIQFAFGPKNRGSSALYVIWQDSSALMKEAF
jgi:hypothetical protein